MTAATTWDEAAQARHPSAALVIWIGFAALAILAFALPAGTVPGWLLEIPPGWRLGLAPAISNFMNWLIDDATFGLFTFREATRAVSAFTETDLPERLPRDSAFVLTPEFRRMGVKISERFPGAEREVMEKEGVRQVIVYRCSEDNGCRRGRS